jgi:hypothetical protein
MSHLERQLELELPSQVEGAATQAGSDSESESDAPDSQSSDSQLESHFRIISAQRLWRVAAECDDALKASTCTRLPAY